VKSGARAKAPELLGAVEGPVYLDTSALVKLYLPEAESAALDRLLVQRRDIVVSDLAVTEVASAIGRRVREGALSDETATRVYRQLLSDADERYFVRMSVGTDTHREAERLLLSSRVPLRTLDALHLAQAIQSGSRSVVTFDRQMAMAAASLGMTAVPVPARS
jgi:predicted nucleic acid-binding protein